MVSAPTPATDPIQSIVKRILDCLDEVGETMIRLYREEIVDYGALTEEILHDDVMANSLGNLRALLANLSSGELVTPEELESFRAGAVRRVHQGISLESLLHSYRLWGQIVWEQILEASHRDDSAERDAALQVAGRVMQHVDFVSIAAAQAYLDEAQGVWSDREVIRRDLLEVLLSGKALTERARGQARSLELDLGDSYVVVLARLHEASMPEGAAPSMRDALAVAKAHLRPEKSSLLVGLRQDEVVALYPLPAPSDFEFLKSQCARFAAAATDFRIGIGGWHSGLAGVATSYIEAREAVEVALRTDTSGRPVAFDDVLIDHILRSSPHSHRFLEDTLGPIREYDARRGSDLVTTLRGYFDSGFNLTRCAAALYIHPNTVVYRLRRIKELTGHNPSDPNDLLLLTLALKLVDLDATPVSAERS